MAKKTRKSTPTFASVKSGGTSASAAAEFNPDYSQVKSDLKRIGILAGSFFVLVIALSFFLK